MGKKVFENGPRVYLDMDGVIADFDRAMTEYGAPAKVVKMIPGVYQHLKPLPHAVDCINELIEHAPGRVFVCTKIPDKAPWVAAEKLFWIHAWLPKLMGKVFIVPDKGAVGTAQDVLVDDHPQWANANNFAGTLVHFNYTISESTQEAIETYPSLARAATWPSLLKLLKELVPSNEELQNQVLTAQNSNNVRTGSPKPLNFG